MKKYMIVLVVLLLLVGCTTKEKTAEKHGRGISVEMSDLDTISYMAIKIYADGLIFADHFLYKEEGYFKAGENVWFDAPVFPGDHLQEIELIYSTNRDGSDSTTTNKIDITKAKEWVNAKLTNELQLELVEYK